VLARDASIVLFGTVGCYICFCAGMESDLNDFKKNRNKSLAFVVLRLLFHDPGNVGQLLFAQLHLTSSILLASMFASHTLLTYPLLGRFGITKNEAVSVTLEAL
jgi:Kef-type K+ transport system membrane component KefB